MVYLWSYGQSTLAGVVIIPRYLRLQQARGCSRLAPRCLAAAPEGTGPTGLAALAIRYRSCDRTPSDFSHARPGAVRQVHRSAPRPRPAHSQSSAVGATSAAVAP